MARKIMAINGRTKGANGEREAAKWLQRKLKLEYCPTRNLEQVRSGGYDLNGLEPLAIEVKRCQTLQLRKWWLQVVTASQHNNFLIPVVMYRQNRQPWRFLVSAQCIGSVKGYVILEEREAIIWMGKMMRGYEAKI